MTAGVIDAWMQHPTLRHANHEMFDSLRRWMGVSMTASRALAQLDDLGFDAETRTLVLTDNARRVFAL
jgi:hypothetical protein